MVETDVQPHCVMQLLVVVGSKKLRLALDCDCTNRYSDKGKVVYPTLNEFARGIEKDDTMVATDCMSGYHTIALQKASWKYFGFEHDGRWFVFTVIPFGWRSACFIYQTSTDVFIAQLRALTIHSSGYLDDASARQLLAVLLSQERLAQLRAEGKHPQTLDDFSGDVALQKSERGKATAWIVCALLAHCGFTLNRAKSQLVPTRQLTFLGLIIDSERLAFNIPAAKHARAIADVDLLMSVDTTDVRSLQVFCGRMMSLAQAAPAIHLFLQPIWKLISSSEEHDETSSCLPWWLLGGSSSGSAIRSLTDDPAVSAAISSFRVLRDWELAHSWGRQKHMPVVVYTDASLAGMGGVIVTDGLGTPDVEWQSAVPPQYRRHPIHILEALAVLHLFREHAVVLTGRHVDLYVDNESVRFALSKYGVKDTGLNDIARQIYEVQLAYRLTVHVRRVATEDNTVADRLSRSVVDEYFERSDHMLTDMYFAKVQSFLSAQTGGTARFTIDVCANEKNRRVRRFYALRYTEVDGFEGVNALSQELAHSKNGEPEVLYCNPPWAILGALFKHAQECHAKGVMIFPDTPAANWYADVVSRSASLSGLAIAGTSDVFTQPSREYAASVGPLPWPLAMAYFDFRQA